MLKRLFCLLLPILLVLSGCAGQEAAVSGPDNEYVILDGVSYVSWDYQEDFPHCPYTVSDQGRYLCPASGGGVRYRLYAVQGDGNRDYLYRSDGAFFLRESLLSPRSFTVELRLDTEDPVYQLEYEYALDSELAGEGGIRNVDSSAFQEGEVVTIELRVEHFPKGAELSGFSMSLVLYTEDGAALPAGTISFPAAFGETYPVRITGSAVTGYAAALERREIPDEPQRKAASFSRLLPELILLTLLLSVPFLSGICRAHSWLLWKATINFPPGMRKNLPGGDFLFLRNAV